MSFTTRYKQPFSLEHAILFDVPVITEEISRLQDSLDRLRSTQTQLQEYISNMRQPDPEIAQAIEENENVIGSQEERISILRAALNCKGVPMGRHYDQEPNPQPSLENIGETNSQEGVYL